MSHFKYEINERKLKRNLKDNEVPFSEDAWLKFESFYASQALLNQAHGSKSGKLSLNSNVTLPIVFGSVITAFVVLLFNFVNIKKPTAEAEAEVKNETVVLAQPTLVEKTVQAKTESQPENKKELVKNTVVATNQQPITNSTPEITNVTAPAYKPVIVVKKRDSVSDTTNIKTEIPNVVTAAEKNIATYQSEPVRAKDASKRKKTQSIVGEPSSDEDEQLPPPMTQSAPSPSLNFH